jgi:hypothetical protein
MIMEQKLPTKPPSIFARFKGKPRRLILLFVGALVTVVLFLAVVQYIMKAGQSTASTSPSNSKPNTIDWPKVKGRTSLRVLKYTSLMVKEEIDKFKAEADKFFKEYDALEKSTKGEQLTPIAGVVEKFMVDWKQELPKRLMADMYRDTVDDYLAVANKVLLKEDGGEFVPGEIMVEVKAIGTKSRDCWRLYQRENQSLDALSRIIGETPHADPRTIQAAVEKRRDAIMLEDLKTMPLRELESVEPLSGRSIEDPYATRNGVSPVGETIEELYRQEKKKRMKE